MPQEQTPREQRRRLESHVTTGTKAAGGVGRPRELSGHGAPQGGPGNVRREEPVGVVPGSGVRVAACARGVGGWTPRDEASAVRGEDGGHQRDGGAKAFGAARLPRALSRGAAGTASPKQAVNGEGDAGPGKSNAGDARSRSAGRRPGDRRAQPCRRPRSADRTGQAQLLQGPHDAPEFKFKPLARACG